MKTALIALVLSVSGPSHVTFAVLGCPVPLPVAWLVLVAEILTGAAVAWLAVRALRGFRSSPWLRPAFPAGATS